jgi:hypothetical protein
LNDPDEKLASTARGWTYIAEGVVIVAAALFLLWHGLTTPLLPVAVELLIFVALLVPAAWFFRAGKRALDEAKNL